MRGLFVLEKNKLGFLDIPEPKPRPYDALVEILYCGICNSTDWKIMEGEFQEGTYPILLGHESVGRIIAIGNKVENYQIGQIVLRPGLSHDDIPLPGGRSCWGGFTERALVTDHWALEGVGYDAVPHRQQTVPSSIDPVEAVAMITLKETISCLKNTRVSPHHSLAIIGTGPVAQALTMFAFLYGISPLVVFGRNPEWERKFLDLGAGAYVTGSSTPHFVTEIETAGGFDRSIEAVGSRAALSRCLQLTKHDGIVNVYGVAPQSEPYLDSGMNDPRVQRKPVREEEAHEELIDWIDKGKVDLSDWISDVLTWDEFRRGFDLVKQKQSNKLVLEITSF